MARKSGGGKSVAVFLALVVVGLSALIYNLNIFERSLPEISLEDSMYWNLKTPMTIKVKDNSGIKRALIQISDGEHNITLVNNKYQDNNKELEFNITFPKTGFYSKKNQYILSIEVIDRSFWNFFMGNKAEKSSLITVDTKQPNIYMIANSYKITKGGSAAVVFKAEDENLKEVYVQTNFGKIFKAAPLNDKGYYVVVIAWPVNEKSFSAEVTAKDFAGNIGKSKIKYFLQDKTYRVSKIQLTDNFLNNLVSPLAEEFAYEETKELSPIDRFKYINEKIRTESVSTIQETTSFVNNNGFFKKIRPFSPLRNGAVVAGFGDFRVYEYEKNPISQSYHWGLDMASTAEADIVLSNSGKVAFAGENGIYGKMILINHGLGVYSLYAHCSNLFVSEGEEVVSGQLIGKTGKTGFVFGDHLHFGVVVQGVEVRPEEWLDEKWLNENIFDLISKANKTISGE
jgi:murein DD-endopeptidase MepM/ murein hydrolase activator NlpD